MDSPPPATTGSPLPSDGSASPPHPPPYFGYGAIAALVIGGGLYMFVLFAGPGLAATVSGIGASYGDDSYGNPASVFGFVAVVLVCVGCGLLWPLFRHVGVPRPTVTLCYLTSVVGVVYLQLFATLAWSGTSSIGWPVWSAVWALALSGFAGLAVLVWTQGREFRWAIAVVVVVVLLRGLADWNSHVEEEREEFDDVVETVSGHAGRAVLLEADAWSAVRAWTFQDEYLDLDYETSEGDWIEVTTWADFAADAPGDPDPADPIRHRCDFERLTCEETEEAGLTVVTVRDESGSGGDLIRMEWSPGVYVELQSREGTASEELRVLVGDLRTVEEDDAVALAEEITGEPRQ